MKKVITNESRCSAIVRLEVENWYGGVKKLDICNDCSDSILKLIDELKEGC